MVVSLAGTWLDRPGPEGNGDDNDGNFSRREAHFNSQISTYVNPETPLAPYTVL